MWIPVLIRAESVRPVIFGGGPVACKKAQTLCRYQVRSLIVCPQPPVGITELKPEPVWVCGIYGVEHLDGATLVIAATDDGELNHRICKDAEDRGIFALNVSDGNRGSLCFPNAGKVDGITVSVSTGGASPTAGAQILSELMETLADNGWPERVRLLGELRRLLRKHEPDNGRRHERMRELGTLSLEQLQKRRMEYED